MGSYIINNTLLIVFDKYDENYDICTKIVLRMQFVYTSIDDILQVGFV